MQVEAKLLSGRKKGRRGDVYRADCPSRGVLDHVTSRWGSLVLLVLLERTHRFSELARTIGGVSDKMLAQSLQALEADGFVLRTVYPTVPPKVEYGLTPLGRAIAGHVRALTNWVEENVSEVVSVRARRVRAKGAVAGVTAGGSSRVG